MPFTYTYRFPVALGTVSLVVLLSLAAVVQAETKTIISEATYSMGDGETPSFAETIVLQKVLYCEQQFKRVKGFAGIAQVMATIEAEHAEPPLVQTKKAA